MSKYKFVKLKDDMNRFDTSTVEFTLDTVNLSDLLDEFKLFLLASGFIVDGDIEIVDNNFNLKGEN